MAYPIATSVVTCQITPETSPHGLALMRVDLKLANQAGPIPEEICLSILLKAGNRTLSAIQDEAVTRAALILASATFAPQSNPELAISRWGQEVRSLPKATRE